MRRILLVILGLILLLKAVSFTVLTTVNALGWMAGGDENDNTPITVSQARQLVATIGHDYGRTDLPEIGLATIQDYLNHTSDVSGRTGSFYLPQENRIVLFPWAQVRGVVIHETAHWLWPTPERHGAQWCTGMAELLARYDAEVKPPWAVYHRCLPLMPLEAPQSPAG